ncbi:sugar-transfer associated ATP-grasp domain-containing protein [Dongia sp.]|uniref:sugar-transfer associated ATP-grasp domain-containing protein n=1 Tax=Dongia sp. TaxID=1977262 RepID=UPI0035B2F316
MAYLRIPTCSPYKLLWPFLKVGGSASDDIHYAYAKYVWEMHGAAILPRVVLHCFAWPLLFAYLCAKHTSRLGKAVKQATGIGLTRQVAEQFWIALRYSISPKKYYVFELFRPNRFGNATHYIARYEFKGGLHNLLESRIENPSRRILNDKGAFFKRCREFGIATVPTFLIIRKDGSAERLLQFDGDLPACDLFVKPLFGKGGRGCERWQWNGDGTYTDGNGSLLAACDLLERIGDGARDRDMMVQEAMRPHEDLRDLSMSVLTSCRMMSVKNETGGFEVTHAVFKSSTRPEAIVDNFHKGGIVSRVDMASGALGPASDSGVGKPCVWYRKHPLTQAQIEGRILPLWHDTVELVRRAHAAFPDRITVGWDVAITDRGPAILEGNVQSGCDMIQRTHDLPAGIGRLAECYAFHVQAALERDVSMAWKVRKGLA